MAERLLRAKELRAMPAADLRTQLETLRRTLWQNRMKLREGTIQHSHEIKTAKRRIARVMTVLNEKQRAAT